MREAMANAPVGDDVYGEDPTINELEERVAALLGKESALYVPAGTMANQIGLALQTRPGDEVLTGVGSHISLYESGGPGANSGILIREVPGDGRFTLDAFEAAVRPDAFYRPRLSLVEFENTHNQGGGLVWDLEEQKAIAERARELGFGTHLDGARLWNAAIQSGHSLAALASVAETVSVCFSKGLGAPVGSCVAFPQAMRQDALRIRHRLGGAMRQGGIIAAGALFAVTHHLSDLEVDHQRAQELGEKLTELGFGVIPPQTNIIAFDLPAPLAMDGAAFCDVMKTHNILLAPIAARRIRAVFHRDLTTDAVQATVDAAAKVIQGAE